MNHLVQPCGLVDGGGHSLKNIQACFGGEDGQCAPYPACGISGLVSSVPGALMLQASRLKVSGFGFPTTGCRFRDSGFGFRISGFGFRVLGFEFTPEVTSQ